MKKKILKWTLNTFIGVMICIITISSVLFVKYIRNPKEVPSFLGYKPLTVLSGSMRPTFEPGDMVIVKQAKEEDIDIGSTITFKSQENTGSYITHRVIEKSIIDGQTVFKTKGDANNTEDNGNVQVNQVVGVYAFKVPLAGYISQFARSKYGFIIFIIIPVGVLIAGEMKTLLIEIRKDKKKKRESEESVEA